MNSASTHDPHEVSLDMAIEHGPGKERRGGRDTVEGHIVEERALGNIERALGNHHSGAVSFARATRPSQRSRDHSTFLWGFHSVPYHEGAT